MGNRKHSKYNSSLLVSITNEIENKVSGYLHIQFRRFFVFAQLKTKVYSINGSFLQLFGFVRKANGCVYLNKFFCRHRVHESTSKGDEFDHEQEEFALSFFVFVRGSYFSQIYSRQLAPPKMPDGTCGAYKSLDHVKRDVLIWDFDINSFMGLIDEVLWEDFNRCVMR